MPPADAVIGGSESGVTIVELLAVLLLVTAIAALAAPVTASVIDTNRTRQAAGFLAGRFRLARAEAIRRNASVGVVFDFAAGGWSIRVCGDGNGNGLRRADIAAGTDPCLDGPARLDDLFPGVAVAVDPTLRGPAGEPGDPDPVRFGVSDVASFSPTGSCSSGSVYLRSASGTQYTVRVAGVTGRIRLLRYEPALPGWKSF